VLIVLLLSCRYCDFFDELSLNDDVCTEYVPRKQARSSINLLFLFVSLLSLLLFCSDWFLFPHPSHELLEPPPPRPPLFCALDDSQSSPSKKITSLRRIPMSSLPSSRDHVNSPSSSPVYVPLFTASVASPSPVVKKNATILSTPRRRQPACTYEKLDASPAKCHLVYIKQSPFKFTLDETLAESIKRAQKVKVTRTRAACKTSRQLLHINTVRDSSSEFIESQLTKTKRSASDSIKSESSRRKRSDSVRLPAVATPRNCVGQACSRNVIEI
jgi:hypothetical protein